MASLESARVFNESELIEIASETGPATVAGEVDKASIHPLEESAFAAAVFVPALPAAAPAPDLVVAKVESTTEEGSPGYSPTYSPTPATPPRRTSGKRPGRPSPQHTGVTPEAKGACVGQPIPEGQPSFETALPVAEGGGEFHYYPVDASPGVSPAACLRCLSPFAACAPACTPARASLSPPAPLLWCAGEINLLWSLRHLLEVIEAPSPANSLPVVEMLYVEHIKILIEETNALLDRIDPE